MTSISQPRYGDAAPLRSLTPAGEFAVSNWKAFEKNTLRGFLSLDDTERPGAAWLHVPREGRIALDRNAGAEVRQR